jgi:hypothetical protein
VDTKDTFASIQPASSAPMREAMATSPAAIKAPLDGMLSHGTIAIGPPPARLETEQQPAERGARFAAGLPEQVRASGRGGDVAHVGGEHGVAGVGLPSRIEAVAGLRHRGGDDRRRG